MNEAMSAAKEKELILERIETFAANDTITKQEVDVAYYKGVNKRLHSKDAGAATGGPGSIGLTEILYYIGAAVVFIGIVILVRENWQTLSMTVKIAVTLGAAIVAYVLGVLCSLDGKTKGLAPAFFVIFGLVAPVGLAIVFNNGGYYLSTPAVQSFISAILCTACLVSGFAFSKKDSSKNSSVETVFTLFSIIFGTWLFFAFTNFINISGIFFSSTFGFDGGPLWSDVAFIEYRVLAVGFIYCLLGDSFSEASRFPLSAPSPLSPLSGPLYGFGILAFLGSALALGGWFPSANLYWETAFPFLIFCVLFLSVYLKSKSFLTFGSIFLVAFIFKITSEYFSRNIGWPLTLVVAGLALMAVGWMSFYLHKKYMI